MGDQKRGGWLTLGIGDIRVNPVKDTAYTSDGWQEDEVVKPIPILIRNVFRYAPRICAPETIYFYFLAGFCRLGQPDSS